MVVRGELAVLPGAGENVFEQVRVEPVTYFNDLVDEERTDWLFFARRPGGDSTGP